MTKKKDPAKVAAAYKGLIPETVVSKRWKLNSNDINKWLKNAAIFFSMGAILFLIQLQNGASVEQAINVFYYWLLSALIDLIRKWASEKTYIV
jgi:hypothetical protein